MAKPRNLPFGEVTAARLHLANRLRQRRFAVKMCEDFLITERLGGLAADRQVCRFLSARTSSAKPAANMPSTRRLMRS